MTSISKIAASGRWRARYRDETGTQHAQHFARKVDAQRWLNEVTASVVRGEYVDPGAGKVTVAAYAATWQAVQVSSPGTARIVDNAVRVHLIPAMGTKPMASVLPSTIQGFVKALEAKGLAAGTIRNVHDVAWRIFDAAVHDRIISRSPFVKIKLPPLKSNEVVSRRSRRSWHWRTRSTTAGALSSSRWRGPGCGSASCSVCRCATSTSSSGRSGSNGSGRRTAG